MSPKEGFLIPFPSGHIHLHYLRKGLFLSPFLIVISITVCAYYIYLQKLPPCQPKRSSPCEEGLILMTIIMLIA